MEQVEIRTTVNDMTHCMYLLAKFTMRLDKLDADYKRSINERDQHLKHIENRLNYLMEHVKSPHACPICEGGVKKHLAAHGNGYGACVSCDGKGFIWGDVA